MPENNPSTPEAVRTPPSGPRAPRRSSLAVWLILALLLAWQWYDGRERVNALREEFAQRLRASDTESRDAMLIARQSRESLVEAQAKAALIELKLAESQTRLAAMESLYRDLSRNREEWVLTEVEQLLAIASQQLQLTGNVPSALAALQIADARLARSRRAQFAAQFTALRAALARDMTKLKTVPRADIAALVTKLDQTMRSIDTLPLAQDARPQPQAPSTRQPEPFWAQFGTWMADQLKQLVRIERTAHDEVLLAPSQIFFLRENLKLRLMNLRLSLLSHDEASVRRDTAAAGRWLERYFDPRSRDTQAAMAALKDIGAAGPGLAIPAIADSLAALRAQKNSSREQAAK